MLAGGKERADRADRRLRLVLGHVDAPWAIASQCGFANVETFRRSFKRQVGVTPTAYRQRFTLR